MVIAFGINDDNDADADDDDTNNNNIDNDDDDTNNIENFKNMKFNIPVVHHRCK